MKGYKSLLKQSLKGIIQKSNVLRKLHALFNQYFTWYPSQWTFDILNSYSLYNKNITFVQIGSNNGQHGDPLHKYIKLNNWKGVLIEPVSYLFNELKCNYKGFEANLSFENSAVTDSGEDQKFYRLKKSLQPSLPYWYDQLGTFKKDVILKHKEFISCFNELFIEETVNTITFKELLKKHEIKNLNLIHIDTEGYDYEIIKSIPFDSLNVDLIMFEHKHLSHSDYKNGLKILRKHGYTVKTMDQSDTIAVKRSIVNKIIRQITA